MALKLDASQGHPSLHYVSFNQDAGCFSTGTSSGFTIYNVSPFKEVYRREFASGVGICKMLFRCNILALVGGGAHPMFPEKKVLIWDDHVQVPIGELSFRSKVLGVSLRRDRVVCALDRKIYSYNFRNLALIDKTETVHNPLGLHALSPSADSCVLAMPGLQRGVVRVNVYPSSAAGTSRGGGGDGDAEADTAEDSDNASARGPPPKTTLINAHESDLVALALNAEGTLLATASEKGTLLRIFDASSGEMLHELRRGAERAVVHSLAFDAESEFVACTSDKGTVHVFRIAGGEESGGGSEGDAAESGDTQTAAAAPRRSAGESSLFGAFSSALVPRYFQSRWSIAQYRINEPYSVVAFGKDKHTVVIVGAEGTFQVAAFDPTGRTKTMRRLHYSSFHPGT